MPEVSPPAPAPGQGVLFRSGWKTYPPKPLPRGRPRRGEKQRSLGYTTEVLDQGLVIDVLVSKTDQRPEAIAIEDLFGRRHLITLDEWCTPDGAIYRLWTGERFFKKEPYTLLWEKPYV